MPIFIDPTGNSTFGIGICGRCSRKMLLTDLYSDPNAPGLMVCKADLDELDPYRLPARQTERINLDFVRPDVPLTGFQEPFQLQGSILTENDLNVLSEDGLLVQSEGESEIETQSFIDLETEDGSVMIVEPWS